MISGIGLRTKTLLGIIVIIGLSGLGLIVIAKPALQQKLFVKLQERGISIANRIAADSINPILTEKSFELKMMLKDYIASEGDISYIFVLDDRGKVLVHTFENGFPRQLSDINRVNIRQKYSLQRIMTEDGEIIDIAVPLFRGEAGSVHVGISAERIKEDVNSIMRPIIWLLIAVLIAGAALGNILSRLITRPIINLTKAAAEVGRGNLDQRVSVDSTDEIGQLAATFNDMLQKRREAEEQIRSALAEKDILLKEVHHRVKNNLQIVASMLQLQSAYICDGEARALFAESQKRIESMSLIHEKMYRAQDLARIDFREYVEELVSGLMNLTAGRADLIETKVNIEGVVLDVGHSIPCGLIINELVSNSLRHAFPDGCGRINVRMYRGNGGRVSLEVADNGIGFPENIDFRNTRSLGMQLVISLVKQLNGVIELDRSKGTFFKVEFFDI